jgi:hypothetical protein
MTPPLLNMTLLSWLNVSLSKGVSFSVKVTFCFVALRRLSPVSVAIKCVYGIIT